MASPAVQHTTEEARALLARFLTRAQSRGIISSAHFHEIIGQWQGTRNSLPANPEDIALDLSADEHIEAALQGLLGLYPSKRSGSQRVDEMEEIIAAWSLRRLLDAHEKVQDDFERKARGFSLALAGGTLSMRAWHLGLYLLIVQHLLQQTILGHRGRLPARGRMRAFEILRREIGYLDRFADQITARQLLGDPYSADYTANRAEAYAGTGRAEFSRALEHHRELFEHLQPKGKPYGLMAEYIARDDPKTCKPCHDAQGFYPLFEGPFPGSVCLGRAHCRCVRVVRYVGGIS
jgi:hypothetical protein